MARTTDITLMASASFLTNLVLIAILVVFAYREDTDTLHLKLLEEDYTRRILEVRRENDIKVGRLQEQLSNIQFTMDRRFELIDDRRFLQQQKE